MTTARSEITSAVLDNKVYVIGGFENGRSPTPEAEVYDPIANKWTVVAPLQQPLNNTTAATVAIGAITSSFLPALLLKSTDGSVVELVMARHNGTSLGNAQNGRNWVY